MSNETVGSLLAVIANSLNDALRIMMFADKRAWGPDEFEQLRLLEETLDEAKRDFQELPALVNGRFYYEHDRKSESLEDLRALCTRFELHAQTFKDWLKTGGPINPVWARDTIKMRRDLHRAQCRAARRIFNTEQEGATRCLGAFLVYRVQRSPENPQQRQLEELAATNAAGKFERLGEHDIAFVCDFCDGHLAWTDLREVPSTRRPAPEGPEAPPSAAPALATTTTPDHWQAIGFTASAGLEKDVVFAPVAVANHLPPEQGDWQASIVCPFCDDYVTYEQGVDDMDAVKWDTDEAGFPDVKSFQEHLEWYHAAQPTSTQNCNVM